MAKHIPKGTKFERRHNESIAAYVRRIKNIFLVAAEKSADVAAKVRSKKPDKIFSFSDYPYLKDAVDELFKEMHDDMLSTIHTASRYSWNLANSKSDELLRAVITAQALKKDYANKYLNNNSEALDAFTKRKIAGMNLSDRVWKLTESYKNELELALDNGIARGISARAMATEVKKYLNEPDKLFRRVRDEHGELKLSQAAKNYHPGRGVYRSSYKNAERLAVTETNMAYRSAEQLKYQAFDFVVGFEVIRSNNPYDCPICGPLAGRYPKTFKFSGWHSYCKCNMVAILMTDAEIEAINDQILNEEKVYTDSVNTVKKPHKGFSDWLTDNKEKLLRAKSKPYFIQDNNIKLG